MKKIMYIILLLASTTVLADIVIVQTPDGKQQSCIVLKGFISCQ